jgi:hypothetical protein
VAMRPIIVTSFMSHFQVCHWRSCCSGCVITRVQLPYYDCYGRSTW